MEEVKDMRDNLINIVVNQKNTLEEQIIMTNKNTTKYIGTACETKIKENEEKNEKIRIERQLRYSENLDSIRLSLDIVRAGLDKIQYDINSYGNKMHEHTIKIDRIEKDIDYLKKA